MKYIAPDGLQTWMVGRNHKHSQRDLLFMRKIESHPSFYTLLQSSLLSIPNRQTFQVYLGIAVRYS